MFLLLSFNALQGPHPCEQGCLRLWTFLFTIDSLFVHTGEPLTTTKQRYINNKANANNMQVFIG